jgi:hypothetical protein
MTLRSLLAFAEAFADQRDDRIHGVGLVRAVVSITTFVPLPAASIMTPMMLFALTLRPLRDICTSLW